MRIQDEPHLRGFGLFKNRHEPHRMERGDFERTERIKTFMEDFIKRIDLEYSRNEAIELNYDLSALLSIINNYENRTKKPMTQRVEKCYNHLTYLIKDSWSSVFDHVFWYEDKEKDILVFESHPYGRIGFNQFESFMKAREKYPDLEIQVLPNSYYFANHTLFIRFIIKNTRKFYNESKKHDAY